MIENENFITIQSTLHDDAQAVMENPLNRALWQPLGTNYKETIHPLVNIFL